MMLTCPGPKVPMWSPAMKLPWVLVIRWISYSGWAFQPQISLGKSWVMTPHRVLGVLRDHLTPRDDLGVRAGGLLGSGRSSRAERALSPG